MKCTSKYTQTLESRRLVFHTFSSLLIFLVIGAHTNLSCSFGEDKQDENIAAQVADQIITGQELEAPLASRIYELQQEIYRLKRERLEQMIAKIVLEKEAEKLGLDAQHFVDEQILSKGTVVSEQEVEEYHTNNRARLAGWSGSEAELKKYISALVAQQKDYRAIMDYVDSLKAKYATVIHLKKPARPLVEVPLEGDPECGPPDAPVTVVEFSDYECSACRRHHEVVRKLRKAYGRQVRWVFKDYPLKGHKWSTQAAVAARCANEQGKFWEYQDLLFDTTGELSEESLLRYAETLKLDMSSFRHCMDNGKQLAQVARNLEEAKNAGISMTPTYIVNGALIPGGPPIEDLTEIIEEELIKANDRE